MDSACNTLAGTAQHQLYMHKAAVLSVHRSEKTFSTVDGILINCIAIIAMLDFKCVIDDLYEVVDYEI